MVIGFGFVYLNFDDFFYKRIKYLFSFKAGSYLDHRVRRLVGIDRIDFDTVYLKNGEIRSILIVEPINFETLDSERQRSVILNYQSFLNQLSFPISIKIRTVNSNVSEYFTNPKLNEKKFSAEAKELYDDFQSFETGFLKKNKVKERLFYVIIPHDINVETPPNKEEKAKKILNQRSDLIRSKLAQCGLDSRRLSTNELISLFMSYFDGYIEVNEDYLNRVTLCKQFLADKEVKK
ncbi:Uncharacterised protein [uncultured archaeon]|nr:Uncharacterised protein [uncultured archaeon]